MKPIGYAADLREIAAAARFYELRQEHARTPAFTPRRAHPGLSKQRR